MRVPIKLFCSTCYVNICSYFINIFGVCFYLQECHIFNDKIRRNLLPQIEAQRKLPGFAQLPPQIRLLGSLAKQDGYLTNFCPSLFMW